MKLHCNIFVFAVLALLSIAVFAQAVSFRTVKADSTDNWSMYRHDAQRSGLSSSPVSNGALLWQFSTGAGEKVRSSPAVADGAVYEGSDTGYVYALNAATGSVIWQYNSGTGLDSSPAFANGVVYVGTLYYGGHGSVVALNAATGAVIWQFLTNSGIESSPAVVNGVVYIGSYVGYVYALNATTGALIWSYLAGAETFSSPAVVNGVVYIGSNDGNMYALNADNGARIWSFQTGNPVWASPVVVDGTVYFNTDNGTVFALRSADGSEIWATYVGNGTDHADDSPAVSSGYVYIGTRHGFYALNAVDGSQIWVFTSPYSTKQTTGFVYSSPAVSGNAVYFGYSDGYVFAVNAFSGSMIWSYQTGLFVFTSPAIANGVVYLGSYDGNIYALGTGTLPTPTPTPTSTPSAFKVSGYILDSNGKPISGQYSDYGHVTFNTALQSQNPGGVVNSSGYYERYIPAGTYTVDVWPPFDSNYCCYQNNGFVVSSDMTQNFTLTRGFKLSGYIMDSQGNPVSGAGVLLDYNTPDVQCSGYFSTVSGYYFLAAPAGNYSLWVNQGYSDGKGGPNVYTSYYENNFVLGGDTIKNITLSSPIPTATPSPTMTPTFTPQATAPPTPNATAPIPTATPQQTANALVISAITPQPSQAPASIAKYNPIAPAYSNPGQPINWSILGGVLILQSVLLALIVLAYKKKPS